NRSGNELWSIAGGTTVVDRVVSVDGIANSPGMLIVTGGRLQTPLLNFGTFGGSAEAVISGGEVQITSTLYVGVASESRGTVQISGGQLAVVNAGSMNIGTFAGIG